MRAMRLLAVQIPAVWETIKYVIIKADEVDKKHMSSHLLENLHTLLNDKAQCFVRLDDNKTLLAMLITRIMIDKITGEKYLFIQNLYSFQMVDDSVWREDMKFVEEFARNEKCSYISFGSRHQRIFDIGKLIGFKEVRRTFSLNIGGEK